MANHFIRDSWALALQRAIATARYIFPINKLETEKPHLLDCDLGATPLDLSFDVDPSPLPAAPAACEYPCVDGDVKITPSVEPFDISRSVNVIESDMTAANEHLQKKEKKKLIRDSKNDTVTSKWIDGDRGD